MLGLRISIVSFVLLASAAAQDYFPLQVGNVWIYKGAGTASGKTLTIEITGTAQFGGVTYAVLHGLTEPDAYLRQDDSGNLFAYDTASGQEKPWFAFQAVEGTAYNSVVSCCGKAMVSSRAGKYAGPIGTFDYALLMSYPGVFQVGIANDTFLPYVGLVSRSTATGGPSYATYDLIYARLGGVTVLSGPQVSFAVTVDKASYPAGLTEMTGRLTLNVKGDPLEITFSSGQEFDFLIRNERGREVYRWSLGRVFTQALKTIRVSGEKNWVVDVKLDNPLPAGQYVAEGYLTTVGGKIYDATVGFEVR